MTKRTPKLKPKPSSPKSPVTLVRKIPRLVELVLYVRAGGRCEFDGCNKPVLENPLTLTVDNFGEKAHIVAFSRGGPRGGEGSRPTDVNALPNLMLLCPTCHLEIDRHADRYPRTVLEKFKDSHERRVELVTSSSPTRKTTIVELKSRIGGKPVAIPAPDVFAAVAPNFPEDRHGFLIDVSEFDDRDPGFLRLATQRIDNVLRPLQEKRLEGQPAHHISVFAFGPIPLLAYLGSCLSDKLQVEFFQFHRDTKTWCWKDAGAQARYKFQQRRQGSDRTKVAILLSLSGTVRLDHLPPDIGADFYLYELTLEGQDPNPMFLNTRADLVGFRRAYLEALGALERDHPPIEVIHLIPAVPIPIAVMCGHDVLNKAHPAFLIYDLDKVSGGYSPTLTINER